mmetsp:Transcript_11219/g.31487  ORF Transcript_11219/g.31487 Transcript_11219/m.31487 type:complete len:276 (-) Transcript_11219:1034-1861(-)
MCVYLAFSGSRFIPEKALLLGRRKETSLFINLVRSACCRSAGFCSGPSTISIIMSQFHFWCSFVLNTPDKAIFCRKSAVSMRQSIFLFTSSRRSRRRSCPRTRLNRLAPVTVLASAVMLPPLIFVSWEKWCKLVTMVEARERRWGSVEKDRLRFTSSWRVWRRAHWVEGRRVLDSERSSPRRMVTLMAMCSWRWSAPAATSLRIWFSSSTKPSTTPASMRARRVAAVKLSTRLCRRVLGGSSMRPSAPTMRVVSPDVLVRVTTVKGSSPGSGSFA